jgi:hypothetical protein
MKSIREEQTDRDQLLRELAECVDGMIFGTISEVMSACGNPRCRCKQGGPKHGPFMHISFRGTSGKTAGYRVPKELRPAVREGVDAWHRFQEIARRLAELNREKLWAEHREAKKKR